MEQEISRKIEACSLGVIVPNSTNPRFEDFFSVNAFRDTLESDGGLASVEQRSVLYFGQYEFALLIIGDPAHWPCYERRGAPYSPRTQDRRFWPCSDQGVSATIQGPHRSTGSRVTATQCSSRRLKASRRRASQQRDYLARRDRFTQCAAIQRKKQHNP